MSLPSLDSQVIHKFLAKESATGATNLHPHTSWLPSAAKSYCGTSSVRVKFLRRKYSNDRLNLCGKRREGARPMATSVLSDPAAKGGSFLLESPAPKDIFTPADLSDDQKLIGQTAEEFVTKEVLPVVKDLEAKKPGLMAELVRKGAEVGLMGGGVPEEYGGA